MNGTIKYLAPLIGIVIVAQMVQSFVPQKTVSCPIEGELFYTYEELYQHYATVHPTDPISIAWEYTNAECSAEPDPVAVWWKATLTATITNVGSGPVTRTVSELWRRVLPVETDWYVINTTELTLVAGEVHEYSSGPDYVITMPDSTVEIYLIDNAGYKSAVCQVAIQEAI